MHSTLSLFFRSMTLKTVSDTPEFFQKGRILKFYLYLLFTNLVLNAIYIVVVSKADFDLSLLVLFCLFFTSVHIILNTLVSLIFSFITWLFTKKVSFIIIFQIFLYSMIGYFNVSLFTYFNIQIFFLYKKDMEYCIGKKYGLFMCISVGVIVFLVELLVNFRRNMRVIDKDF